MSHKHFSPQQQPQRQTQLIEYAYAKFLIGCENQKINNDGNAFLMRGLIISEEDVRYQSWIQHLIGLGVDVADYGVTANALSYAYTPVIPDYGTRGQVMQVLSPASKSNSENTNIVLTQPQTEDEQK